MALITHQTKDDSTAFIRSSGYYLNTWRKTGGGLADKQTYFRGRHFKKIKTPLLYAELAKTKVHSQNFQA